MNAPNDNETFAMVQEATDFYKVRDLPEGRIEIHIIVPERFSALWLVKLSELRGTVAEVNDCDSRS